MRRLFETEQSIEEFEPALSLTMAACWLQAGMPDKARETLVALRERHPSLRVTIAGRETPIFTNNAEAVDWLVKLIGAQPIDGGGGSGSLVDVPRRRRAQCVDGRAARRC